MSGVERAAAGDVCAAVPVLSRFSVPAGSTERAYGGADQLGRTAAGAVTELQVAGWHPAHGPRRSWRAEEAPSRKKELGRRTNAKPRPEGYADADDVLHGSSQSLHRDV